ncbi:transcriptional regulator [Melghirimyces profundicolus]|uniref:Transcriptional regulator n=1 Tax=Melghirimyces profundicolus TaxID=1242148 RepID=A0A2T6C0K0_9BACL|nr:sigma-54-dependent Fis family transcriptional regulator [Melghirimyces profundicolus]PTX61846.1 transcriptional regulator [Melghirimyces profundicolus]
MSRGFMEQVKTVQEKGSAEERVGAWMTDAPHAVTPEESLREAAEILVACGIDGLPVVDADRHVVGLITQSDLTRCYVRGVSPDSAVGQVMRRPVDMIGADRSITEAFRLKVSPLPVVDSRGVLVGMLTRAHILQAYSHNLVRLRKTEYTAETLSAVLESAYEGVVVCDAKGIIREFNDAYSRFLGKKRGDVLGKHVTKVIENTRLHIVVKTGIPEIGYIQRIQGQDMVVHRIPIWKEGEIVGAVGMLIFEGVTELYRILERKQELSRQVNEKAGFVPQPGGRREEGTFEQIIGQSEEMASVKRMARRAAAVPATVLITGESGTGKEMFAKAIHHASPFADGPFVSINCAAIPEHLLEAELFGYEGGAFTGARKGGKPGKFELAHKGTLFLDEIGDMPLPMQAKILRVLQDREVERVGGVSKHRVDVRIIAATNQDLEQLFKQGRFRKDLYYRLNIIHLYIPPLRERKKDIPFLLSRHLQRFCQRYNLPPKQLARETMTVLMDYDWPGNVRELANTVERLVCMAEGEEIRPQDLPPNFWGGGNASRPDQAAPPSPMDLVDDGSDLLTKVKRVAMERERASILRTLAEVGGNKAAAARQLGIHRSTLYEKLKKYGLD